MLLQTRKWMLEGEFEVEIADTVPEPSESSIHGPLTSSCSVTRSMIRNAR